MCRCFVIFDCIYRIVCVCVWQYGSKHILVHLGGGGGGSSIVCVFVCFHKKQMQSTTKSYNEQITSNTISQHIDGAKKLTELNLRAVSIRHEASSCSTNAIFEELLGR